MADIKYLDHVRNELIALGCIMYCILITLVIKYPKNFVVLRIRYATFDFYI